jgi:hypothetical protein
MQLMKLDTATSTYAPIAMVEHYDSLIWTERYRNCGDFQLKTPEINTVRTLLPIGSLVAISQSTEAMFVEDHLIEKDPDGEAILTVSGRTFESFLENRVSRQDGQEALYIRGTGGNQDSSRNWAYVPSPAYSLAWQYIFDKTEKTGQLYGQTIPNFKVFVSADFSDVTWPNRDFTIKPGELYEQVLELLAMDDLGIRSVRPEAGNNPEMQLFIYYGQDKTATVVLSTSAGHFESASYLWSIRDHKNTGHAFSYYGFKMTSNVSVGFGVGLNRRIGFVDATDIKSASGVNDSTVLTARTASYLKRYPLKTMFDGEVSVTIPYKYSIDYYLGDLIKVVGDYGVNQSMQVTEYTRIEDREGERSYPTLTIPGITAT